MTSDPPATECVTSSIQPLRAAELETPPTRRDAATLRDVIIEQLPRSVVLQTCGSALHVDLRVSETWGGYYYRVRPADLFAPQTNEAMTVDWIIVEDFSELVYEPRCGRLRMSSDGRKAGVSTELQTLKTIRAAFETAHPSAAYGFAASRDLHRAVNTKTDGDQLHDEGANAAVSRSLLQYSITVSPEFQDLSPLAQAAVDQLAPTWERGPSALALSIEAAFS